MNVEIDDVYGGWEQAMIPDDIAVTISHDGSTTRVHMSLEELIEVYTRLAQSGECNVIVGTSQLVKVVRTGERTAFVDMKPVQAECDVDDLVSQVRSVLATVFELKDERSDDETREDQLVYMRKDMERKGIEIDPSDVYSELAS